MVQRTAITILMLLVLALITGMNHMEAILAPQINIATTYIEVLLRIPQTATQPYTYHQLGALKLKIRVT